MKKNSAAKSSSPSNVNYLFIILVVIELMRLLYVVLGNRMVVHDSFFRFTFQYYFLNNYFQSGQLPHWIPYMTHGTTAYWWHTLQGIFDLSTYVIPLTGKVFKSIPYFVMFNLGIFCSRLILLTGCWLLGRRLFKSSCSIFVVTLSIMASSIGESQGYFNFSFYYALPLIIYLGHRFIDTALWRYFFMAINLYALQVFGNAAYFIPVSSLVLCVYFTAYGVLNFKSIVQVIQKSDKGLSMLLSLTGVGVSLFAVYYFMKQGFHSELVRGLPGRTLDGSVLFSEITNWAQTNTLAKWADLVLGVSLEHDATLYIGLLSLLLIVAALFALPFQKAGAIVITIIFLFFFSRATLLTRALYEYWPLMGYYKHLYLISPLIRFWLCFVAGFGCDYLMSRQVGRFRDYYFLFIGIIFCAFGIAIFHISTNIDYIVELCDWMGFYFIGKKNELGTLSVDLIRNDFFWASIRNVVLGVLVLFGFFQSDPKWRRAIVIILLGFHMVELGNYSYRQINRRTVEINTNHHKLLEYQEMPFAKRRVLKIPEGYTRGLIATPDLVKQTVMYWSFNAFLFNDAAGSIARADHWLKPFDQLMRTLWGQSLNSTDEQARWIDEDNLSINLPVDSESAKRLSSVTADKIGFYADSYWLEDLDQLKNVLRNPSYTGGRLFLSDTSQPDVILSNKISEWSSEIDLEVDDRINLNYHVDGFDSNSVDIKVVNPQRVPIWMLYGDVWHPSWRASINGLSVPVYRAQMAYKAVKIPPGENEIRFEFFKPKIEALTRLIGVNCLFWMLWVVWATGRLSISTDISFSQIEIVDT